MIDLRSPRRRHAGANGAARGLWNASAGQVQSRPPTVTPVGAVARGLVAGAVGRSDGHVPVRTLPPQWRRQQR